MLVCLGASEELKEPFRGLLLVFGGLGEDGGDLLEALLLGWVAKKLYRFLAWESPPWAAESCHHSHFY